MNIAKGYGQTKIGMLILPPLLLLGGCSLPSQETSTKCSGDAVDCNSYLSRGYQLKLAKLVRYDVRMYSEDYGSYDHPVVFQPTFIEFQFEDGRSVTFGTDIPGCKFPKAGGKYLLISNDKNEYIAILGEDVFVAICPSIGIVYGNTPTQPESQPATQPTTQPKNENGGGEKK